MTEKEPEDARDLKKIILADDIALILDALESFASYDFASDVSGRMRALGLSASALAGQCMVTHTIVGKWCAGNARPHGKERMKELGMALGMDIGGLNAFLYANGYPGLYVKNPLDSACKLVLLMMAGKENIVPVYRSFLDEYGLNVYVPSPDRQDIATTVMSRAFDAVADFGDFDRWLSEQKKHFGASAKTQMPNARLIRLILLYIGSATVYELYAAGELPVTLKNLLYPLLGEREVAVRGLREKLIAFGLYCNMTEEEMDVMLEYAKLRPFSKPETRLDMVMLVALRCAHERYPYFEYTGMQRLTAHLRETAGSVPPAESGRLCELLALYEEQMENAAARVRYYEDESHKSETDLLFEKHYTAYADRGIIDYMRDVLTALCAHGVIKEDEAGDMLGLIREQRG